jgi:hypothetical protein
MKRPVYGLIPTLRILKYISTNTERIEKCPISKFKSVRLVGRHGAHEKFTEDSRQET